MKATIEIVIVCMTTAELDEHYNRSMSEIWENILWIDERLESEPNPQKQAELERIMDRLKDAMRLKRETQSHQESI